MMERIKKGIVLKPVSRQQVCRLSRHALRGQKSFSFTTVFNVSDFARRKTTTRGRSVAMPVWFCLSWIGPCSLSANPEIVLAGPEGRKQEIGHYGTEANAGKKKKKTGETHIGILRPRPTAVFFKHLHQLCTPGQSETTAPPRSGAEDKNEQECGGGGAPAGPSEEEESDGRQPGAQHLHANSGYFVLSPFWVHYFTVCNNTTLQKLGFF